MNNSGSPLVSVVIPIYNGEKYIEQTIESVLSQTYQNWELVIINDGSSDHSEELVLKYRDERIRYFRNDGNKGISYSLNKGLNESRGEFIARLDADDISLPTRLEKQVGFLTENRDYVLCGSYFQTINPAGRILKDIRFPDNNRDAKSYLLLHNCFCQSAVMMKASIAKEIKYDPEFKIGEDYDLWHRISRMGKIINLPLFTTYYRIHDTNITKKNDVMFENVNKINKKILDDLGIEYSDKELELHSNALSYRSDYFKDKEALAGLEKWFYKLYSFIKKNGQFNDMICYRIMAEKWIVNSFNSGHTDRVFVNRLLFLHPAVYLKRLLGKAVKNIN